MTWAAAISLMVVLDFVPCVICFFKGKLWTGFFGLFIPFVAIVGAIRVARPDSPWARRRYPDKPRKLAKAERREAHVDRTWRAWREALFDLLAGKPHLPSLSVVTDQVDPDATRPGAREPGALEPDAAGQRALEEAAKPFQSEVPPSSPAPAGEVVATPAPPVAADPVRKAG